MPRPIPTAFLLAAALSAQTTNGTIVGSVRDTSDLAVVNADVRLTQTTTAAIRRSATNERGDFTFTSVVPGEYSITVSSPGFKSVERKGINLTATETLPLGNIKLEVGAVSETVSVVAQSATVQTASSERSGVIVTSQVENLAIRGRNVSSLAKLLPGVVLTSESDQVDITNNIRALGGRSTSNNIQLDGVPMNDIGNNNGYSVYVSMDAVAEVKILLGNYAAEYGRLSGANVQMITKSGTRDFHGLVSYFKRHEEFNANNFFNNRLGLAKPSYRFNTWNYNLGGPVYIPGKFNRGRDKLFFFWSQEFWPIKTNGAIGQVTVPTALERAGDFSQSLDLNGRLIPVRDPAANAPFPDNKVPTGRIDPSGQALLKVFPLPNFLDTNISARRYNYVFQETTTNPKRTQTLRADYNFDSKNVINGSYSFRNDDQTAALGLGTSGATNWPQMVKTFYSKAELSSIRYTRIINPTLVNEFTFGHSTRPQGDRATDEQVKKNQREAAGFTSGQFHPENNPLHILPNATYGGHQPRQPVRRATLPPCGRPHRLEFHRWPLQNVGPAHLQSRHLRGPFLHQPQDLRCLQRIVHVRPQREQSARHRVCLHQRHSGYLQLVHRVFRLSLSSLPSRQYRMVRAGQLENRTQADSRSRSAFLLHPTDDRYGEPVIGVRHLEVQSGQAAAAHHAGDDRRKAGRRQSADE